MEKDDEFLTDEEDDTLKSIKKSYCIFINICLEVFPAPSLDKDEGPSNSKSKKAKNENDDEDNDDDESYPLLKETNLGGSLMDKALKRQCR
jgi:hypothetical protein